MFTHLALDIIHRKGRVISGNFQPSIAGDNTIYQHDKTTHIQINLNLNKIKKNLRAL